MFATHSSKGGDGDTSEFGTEVKLLLACARTRLDTRTANEISRLAAGEIHWRRVVNLARRHALLPLLHRNLNKTCAERVPADILRELDAHFRRNTLHNLYLAGELGKLLNLFARHGIEAVPFKGPVLTISAYGDLTLRQFGDLDVLVRQGDVLHSKNLLIAEGFQPEKGLTGEQEKLFLASEYVWTFVRENDDCAVELHWRLSPRYFAFALEDEPLWERIGKVHLPGGEVNNLAPEDNLLMLCAHGTKHTWERIAWVCDIAELIRAEPGINWRRVHEQARRIGGERILLLGLALAHELLDAEIPIELQQRIEGTPTIRELVKIACFSMFNVDQSRSEGTQLFTFHLKAKDNYRDCLRYCLRAATIPSIADWQMLRLPPNLSFLYRLLRPLRLVKEHGARQIAKGRR